MILPGLIAARVVLRANARALAVFLVPSAVALLLALTQADAVVDWGVTERLIRDAPGWVVVPVIQNWASWFCFGIVYRIKSKAPAFV